MRSRKPAGAMIWLLGFMALSTVAGTIYWFASPRVPGERIADEDLELVRDQDRAAWRRQRLTTYQSWKKNDDFFRIAAFRTLVADGMTEAEARARVREEYPFYYLDPAVRVIEGFAGDDAGLPIAVRARVERNARILKELTEKKDERFRTMNALVRACIRTGAF